MWDEIINSCLNNNDYNRGLIKMAFTGVYMRNSAPMN